MQSNSHWTLIIFSDKSSFYYTWPFCKQHFSKVVFNCYPMLAVFWSIATIWESCDHLTKVSQTFSWHDALVVSITEIGKLILIKQTEVCVCVCVQIMAMSLTVFLSIHYCAVCFSFSFSLFTLFCSHPLVIKIKQFDVKHDTWLYHLPPTIPKMCSPVQKNLY